jgi:hypothetical protein
MCFFFRQHKRLLMYYNVMTKAIIVILSSFSLKEKQDDRYNQS